MNYLRTLQLRRGYGPMLSPDKGAGGGDPAPNPTAADPAPADPKGNDPPPADPPPKTFTQADIDKLIGKTIAAERTRAEQATAEAVAQARTEAEQLAKMDAEERAKHEAAKHTRELADREAAITRRELRAQAMEQLAEKGLPSGLADLLAYTDAEACSASIEAAEKVFRAAVQQGVNERLANNNAPTKPGARADLDKMSDDDYYNTTLNKKKE